MCIRFSPRFNVDCECLRTSQGGLLQWTNQSRYIGVYLVSGHSFKFSLDHSKSQFFKAFNAILSKVGRLATEDVVLRAKCLPVLLYGVECCPMLTRDKRSLEFTVTRAFMKLFRTCSATVLTIVRNFSVYCRLRIK